MMGGRGGREGKEEEERGREKGERGGDSPLHDVCVSPDCRAAVCIQCDVTWTLMHSFSSGSGAISALPPKVQKGLMGCLVMCAYGERKKDFLAQVSVEEFLGECEAKGGLVKGDGVVKKRVC